MAYLFVVGFVSILGQVALLRELNVAFYGVELIYSLALGVWLLCTAAGTWISRRIQNPSRIQISLLLGPLSILIPLDVAFIRAVRILFSGVPGAYLPFQTQILAMLLALLPIGLLLGLLFQWSAKGFIAGGRSLALAYAIESAGGIVGGMCATLFLKLGVQNFRIALICSLVALIPPLLIAGCAKAHLLRYLWGLLAVCLIWAFWQAQTIDRKMTAWTHSGLVETRDSPYSRVTITQLGDQTSVFENDALSFDTEGTEAEEFVHLAALQHPNPKRVLILGGGIEGLVYEILKHSPSRVDYVELNPVYLKAVGLHLPAEFSESIRRPNVRILIADPREILSRAETYDLILVGMPEPGSGQANRFYTEEFYRQCHARLNANGIVGFRLRSSENYWTPQLAQRMVSIYRAARSVFRDVLVLPGSTNIVIGSNELLTRDPIVPVERLRQRLITARLISPAYIQYLYRNDRFAQISQTLESGTAPINTDTRPICYQYTVMLWLSKFFPGMANVDFSGIASRGLHPAPLEWSLLVTGLVLFIMSRRRRGLRRALLMGMAGFLGMVMETILILHYQVKNGILFQDLGMLLMSFMAGLTAGALALELQARVQHVRDQMISRIWGLGLVAGFAPLAAWIGYRGHSGLGMGLLETAVLQALSGFLVAGVFAYASLSETNDVRRAIAPLYSADLIGGCVGSLVGTLILIPIAGLVQTSLWMIPIAFLTAVLV
jgi:spermidine synthase